MRTATETATEVMGDTIDTLSDALEDVTEAASKKSHKLLKLIIVLGVIGIIFAIVKQLTSDSEPEPYEPSPGRVVRRKQRQLIRALFRRTQVARMGPCRASEHGRLRVRPRCR